MMGHEMAMRVQSNIADLGPHERNNKLASNMP